MSAPKTGRGPRPLTRLERAGVVALLFAALVPRVRDLFTTFDRHFEGFQGAFFAVCAINYERMGFDAFGGYPLVNIDLPDPAESESLAGRGLYTYPNHPPTVAWMGWAALKLLGPEGWADAWRHDQAPEGVEAALRFPFLLLHVLGIVAFYWAIRQSRSPQESLLALALLAVLPLHALYSTLVNYENPSLVWVLFAYGFYARYARSGGRANLVGLGAMAFLACSMTYGPLFFLPPLVLQLALRRQWRRAIHVGAVAGGAALVPLIAHVVASRRALDSVGLTAASLPERLQLLLAPLFDGSAPLSRWCVFQAERLSEFFSLPIVLAALAGLITCAWPQRPDREAQSEGDRPLQLGLPLLLGGVMMLLGYYRHTYDEGVQDPFLLNLAPAAAALGATFLQRLSIPLSRLQAGIAPLVAITGIIAMPAVARMNELHHRWRSPGPADGQPADALVPGPPSALPATSGATIAGILPPGAAGLYPRELGFNFAVAFYAWRSLLDVDKQSYDLAVARLTLYGRAGADRYLLLPINPPSYLRELVDIESIRAEFAAVSAPAARSTDWELWPLQ